MKAFATADFGIEEVTALEVKEVLDKECEQGRGHVVFESEEIDVCKLCYKGQSVRRAGALLSSFNITDLASFESNLGKVDFSGFIKRDTVFSVTCQRTGKHDFNSSDVIRITGNQVRGSAGGMLDFRSPEVHVFVFIHDKECFVGIDFGGEDLSKREYKIFSNPQSIRGTLAYALVRLSGIKQEEVLLDPFCKSGEVGIEAALYSTGISPNHYDKDKLAFLTMDRFADVEFDKVLVEEDPSREIKILCFDSHLRNVAAAKKNAKIAGVVKSIDFSRTDPDWLDIKLEEGKVDAIATSMPMLGKHKSEHFVEKLMRIFFEKAEHLLKKGGAISVLTNKKEALLPHASAFGLEKELQLALGESILHLLVFRKL